MLPNKFSLLLALTLAGSAMAQTPAMPGPAFKIFKSPDEIKAACDSGLDGAAKRLSALEKRKLDGGWIAAYDDFAVANEDVANDIDFTQYVHPDKAMRDAAQACSLRWSEFNSALLQNEKIYAALKKAPTKDAIDRELVRVQLGNFEDGGVALAAAKRERAKKILDQITALDQQFNKNIREAGIKVPMSEADLKGVPESAWAKKPKDEQGRYLLGVDNPTYSAVMQSAESGDARQRMYVAKNNEGGEANIKVLAEIAALRHELAGLFGYDNYVDFRLRHKMAKNSATAWKFLDDVHGAVAAGEKADVAELRKVKAQHLGTAADATKIERWDETYYAERLRRERYSVDQEAFRPYFPPEEALAFTMKVIEKLMGVRYTPVQGTLWHPETRSFVVTDVATGKAISQFYVDLFPREGKYNHAAVWPLRASAMRIGRTPTAAMVVNFDRKGLSLNEMVTLLHEFGHAVHVSLSTSRYAVQAGTTVLHDFVEAPSQMLEDWVYDKKVLKLMAEVCASCKLVPDEMVDKAIAAKKFAEASGYARQHLYASYDLALNGKQISEPMALWSKMEGATPIGYAPGTRFPSRFAHLTSDYGSGYYGYLWSRVLAYDLRTAFLADKLDAKVGAAYRSKVLAQGSQRPAPELVKDFLGRDWNSKAFFEELSGKK